MVEAERLGLLERVALLPEEVAFVFVLRLEHEVEVVGRRERVEVVGLVPRAAERVVRRELRPGLLLLREVRRQLPLPNLQIYL